MALNAYAECHYPECDNKVHYGECHYAECRYAECRGAIFDALYLHVSRLEKLFFWKICKILNFCKKWN